MNAQLGKAYYISGDADVCDPRPATLCIYIPQSLAKAAIKSIHKALLSGHPGVTRTTELVKNRFFWRRLAQDVSEYVVSCPICSLTKHSQSHENPTFSISDKSPPPSHMVYMDVVGPLPKSGRKNTYWSWWTHIRVIWWPVLCRPRKLKK